MTQQEEKSLHLVGIGVTHSIAYGMHNFIAKSLGLPWTFYSTECATLGDLLELARKPTTAGLVVTMPYKTTIMAQLDELDGLAAAIGACNNVYYDNANPRRLCGTNTDWLGIKGCLLEKTSGIDEDTWQMPVAGLIVGAGGASRAALYALTSHLDCTTIYVLNRDDQEVKDLIRDSKRLPVVPQIVHIKAVEQVRDCLSPRYVVGTVPDLEPKTDTEKNVAAMLRTFLERPEKGVLLDMCFKPRRTRMIKLAENLGWPCVEGTHVIGYQIEKQWDLWAGEEICKEMDKDGAWKVLLKAADESKAINF